MKNVKIKNKFHIGNKLPIILIAGPCQIESLSHSRMMTEKILDITEKLNINLIYKSSFDKANRTSVNSARGIGFEKGIEILKTISTEFNVPTITDIHESYQAEITANYVDVLQIPAFLCRQTDLLKAAAETKKPVMVKKGQFLSPDDMKNVAEKLKAFGNNDIILCERGTSFGYNTLVSDFKGVERMKDFDYPVIFDATHSVQQPGGLGGKSGGERRYVETLSKAAVAVGVAGLFIETHEDPDNAPSDGPNMIHINDLEKLLTKIITLDTLVKDFRQ